MSTTRVNVLDRTAETADVSDNKLAAELTALSTRVIWPWSMPDSSR